LYPLPVSLQAHGAVLSYPEKIQMEIKEQQ
jgi:hypothetical protein